MADIFVSYKREDRARIEPLVKILKKQGWTIWWDPDIKPGNSSWDNTIERELHAARCIVVVWSRLANDSHYVRTEAHYGRTHNILVPATIDTSVPTTFNLIQTADLSQWFGDPGAIEFQKLLDGITSILGEPSDAAIRQPVHIERLAQSSEREAWDAVKDNDDPAAIEKFLEHYPDGEFSWLARPALNALLEEHDRRKSDHASNVLENEAQEHWAHIEKFGNEEAVREFYRRYQNTFFARKMAKKDGIVIVQNRVFRLNAPFKDAAFAPEMVLVPPGKFLMGSKIGEGEERERPQHEVKIDYPMAVGRFAVTFDEWDYYAAQLSTARIPPDRGWGRDQRPVINVSWEDAQGYVKWLSRKTGQTFRLLSEAEWEYVANAGSHTRYWWGEDIDREHANYDSSSTTLVDSYSPNPWGLYNVHGNVWEWCEDYWHRNYKNAPVDGSARRGGDSGYSTAFVLRGGSWDSSPERLTVRSRVGYNRVYRGSNTGFRVARELDSSDYSVR